MNKLQKDNPRLIEAICHLHQSGQLLPDSYVMDLEQFRLNAAAVKKAADERGIRLYFMLKQLGRNPVLARELTDMGYEGAVVVDFKEAQVMMRHHIPISNVGHLVQTPEGLLEKVVAYGPEVVTVFTEEKARSIDRAAKKTGKIQKILVRVFDDSDMIYSGQTAGISLGELPDFLNRLRECTSIRPVGVTSFPCYLYQEELGDIAPTPNLKTVLKGAEIMRTCGYEPEIINTPSATCVRTLELMSRLGGNCGEPGHGLTATTPAHAVMDLPEKSCIAYVSEISHNFDGKAYCYGGGHYRRSHLAGALVGREAGSLRQMQVTPPSLESIDYHFELPEPCAVGETVIMAFRYQIFVTRSDLVLLEGVSEGCPRIVGVYDSLGNEKSPSDRL